MENINWKEILKGLVVLGVIILLSLMFPTSKETMPQVKEGGVWTSEDLFAHRDFEVKKTEAQLVSEQNSLKEKILPIYIEDNSAEINSINNLIIYLSPSIDEVNANQQFFREKIQRLFAKGVVDVRPDGDRFELEKEGQRIRVESNSVMNLKDLEAGVIDELSKLGVSTQLLNGLDLEAHLRANYIYNDAAYQQKLKIAFDNLPTTESIIKKGELIIAKGEPINEPALRKLTAYNVQHQSSLSSGNENWIKFIGYLILTCLIIGGLLLYIRKYYSAIDDKLVSLLFVLLWPLLFGFLIYGFERTASLSAYMVPFCIVPIIVKNFYPGRLAFFMHVVVVLIASILTSQGYEFTLLQILAGIITVLVVSETRYWNKFFVAILLILATYIIAYTGLALIREGSLSSIDPKMYMYLGVNGILMMLAYPFIPLVEKIFGFTSTISLVELSDMNRPLLKDLSIKAPGTLQHSLQVANLAEAAADKIGANSVLIKTAALYHDIGKMNNPKYFIENASAEENLHDALNNNFESAKIIIDHVIEGERMAKKARLPQVLIDFITTHHGTTRVEYFYRKLKSAEPDREFDESLFRYPGPKPTTKEQSIMMLADSIEAASKSLKQPTGQDIDNLVDKIISYKIEQGQLELSALSFEELASCKEVFKSLLRSISHVRVEYPEDKGD